jgi:hypothetical protein
MIFKALAARLMYLRSTAWMDRKRNGGGDAGREKTEMMGVEQKKRHNGYPSF